MYNIATSSENMNKAMNIGTV